MRALEYDSRRYVLRPHAREPIARYLERHDRFFDLPDGSRFVIAPDRLESGFVLLDDLDPEYRDALEERGY